MSYLHIPNLYKADAILSFKKGYAMEKVHGTSAHIRYRVAEPQPVPESVVQEPGALSFDIKRVDSIDFFSGGSSYLEFIKLFNKDDLFARFREFFPDPKPVDCTVYGEAYGGKMQGMSKTYGPALQFVAFEVKIGDNWLSVSAAAAIVSKLGLEFVPWREIEFTQEAVDAERNLPSIVCERRLGPEVVMPREGIVLRPPFEVTLNNGSRLIAKHKAAQFCETKSKREADPNKATILAEAEAIADEWVTRERLMHVVDRLRSEGVTIDITATGKVIDAMYEDVDREAGDEIIRSKEVRKSIGTKARLHKAWLGEGGV